MYWQRRVHIPPLAGTVLAPLLDEVIAVEDGLQGGEEFAERRLAHTVLFTVVSGRLRTRIDDRTLEFRTGCVGLIGTGALHAQRVETRCQVRYLLLRGTWADRLRERAGTAVLVDGAPARWRGLLGECVDLAEARAPAWDARLLAGLAEVAAHLLLRAAGPEDADLATRLGRLVDADPARDWTVAGMAQALAMSDSALAHRCTTATGLGPAAWVRRRRMEHARHLLASATPADVSARLGFAAPSHFSRTYRAVHGATPGRDRQRLLAALADATAPGD